MPGPWTLLHPEAKPSPKDIETIHFMTFYGERSQQLLDLLKKHAVAFKPIIRPPALLKTALPTIAVRSGYQP